MRSTRNPALWLALVLALAAGPAQAEKKTVCTITINSADEKEIFQRSLPSAEFDFIELVDHQRPDWFGEACRKGVQCDVLVISGHFDGGTDFYSDRPGVRGSLAVEELERASCSDSCPGVFARLKEVYLFGCNTLNPEPMHTASAEVTRSLLRARRSAAEAEQVTRALNERYGESNRDRMRQIFAGVPTIYGFTGKAPLGPSARGILERYFQSGARNDIGTGRPSTKLVSLFAPVSMTATSGIGPAEPLAEHRRDLCQLADDRRSVAQKLAFVHAVLQREPGEARLFLDLLEKHAKALATEHRDDPEAVAALTAIAADHATRTRFIEFLRDADETSTRARMIEVATHVGWLTAEGRRAELMRMVGDRLAATQVSAAEVDLVCELNRDGALGQELHRLGLRPPARDDSAHAALTACLGSAQGRARLVDALTSGDAESVHTAQVYFRHHPLADVAELRSIAVRIGAMNDAAGQVRALDTLAPLKLADRESLAALTRLFPVARTVGVQRAIAGVLIRAEEAELSKPELARVLREHRLRSPDGEDLIDVLIRRFQRS